MRRPIIGVSPLWDGDKSSIWMLPNYMNGITQAGGIPIILPLRADRAAICEVINMCDGILLTGGQDVNPRLYGEEMIDGVVCSEERDHMEQMVLECALEQSKPILGICRGIQFLNVYFGGTLYQDLPTQHPSPIGHSMKHPYDSAAHEVSIVCDTPLYALIGRDAISVNSLHHQAVKSVADGLLPMAISSDGLVEALYHPDYRFLWALQWHPEYSYLVDSDSCKIFEVFINSTSL